VDYETQLKNEINSAVKEKLSSLEEKVLKVIEEHSKAYAKDFEA